MTFDEMYGDGALADLIEAFTLDEDVPTVVEGECSPINDFPGGEGWIMLLIRWSDMVLLIYARGEQAYYQDGMCMSPGGGEFIDTPFDVTQGLKMIDRLAHSQMMEWAFRYGIRELRHRSPNQIAQELARNLFFDVDWVGPTMTELVAEFFVMSKVMVWTMWARNGYPEDQKPFWLA